MRRLFYVLGIVFSVIIIGVVGLVGLAIRQGSALDTQSKAYIERAIADIGKDWDRTELIKRASPGLLEKASGEQIEVLFQHLRGSGGLRHYDGAKGQAVMSVFVGSGSTVRAHYEAKATFRSGAARFRIDLLRVHEQWMVDGFFVDISPADLNSIVRPT